MPDSTYLTLAADRSSTNGGRKILARPSIRPLTVILFLVLLVLPIAIPLRVLVLAGAALIWTFLEAGNLKPLGLGRRGLASTLGWGVGVAIAVTVLGEAFAPLIERVLSMKSDYSGYGALAGNAGAAFRLLEFALTSAAIGEEVLFRGFLLHQLTGILGRGNRSRWVSIVTSGAIFGAAHMIQGPTGMLTTGIVGMVFAWAWFRSGRNLWALMLAHAIVDSSGIAMLYFGRYA